MIKEQLLQDVIEEISMGPFGSDIKVVNFTNEGVPVLNGANLTAVKLVEDSFNFVTTEKADSLRKANARTGDLVITHRGTLGQVSYIPKNSKFDRYLISQSQFRVRFKKDVDPIYLAYLFHTAYGQRKLLSFKNHVGVPALAQATTNFRQLRLRMHALPEQRKIASLLSTLDEKISLNTRINSELESLAKSIYDYWFVQFDFPTPADAPNGGEPGKPYKAAGGKMVYNEVLKREVPEGWEVKSLLGLANTGSGGTPKSSVREYYDKGTIPWINSGELNSPFIISTQNYITEIGLKNSNAKLFPEDTILVAMYGATAGKVSLLKFPACTNQAICAVMPHEKCYTFYLKFCIEKLYEYLVTLSTGSARDNLSQDLIKKLNVLCPVHDLLEEFHKTVSPLYEKYHINLKQNLELARLRDWLLPLLMNGQVTVREAYERVGEVLGVAAEAEGAYGFTN